MGLVQGLLYPIGQSGYIGPIRQDHPFGACPIVPKGGALAWGTSSGGCDWHLHTAPLEGSRKLFLSAILFYINLWQLNIKNIEH